MTSPVMKSFNNLYRLGQVLVASGQRAGGEELLEKAIEIGHQSNLGMIYIPAELFLATSHIQYLPLETVQQEIERLEGYHQLPELALEKGIFHLLKSEFALKENQPDEAAACAEAVVAEGRNCGHIWLEIGGLQTLLKCARPGLIALPGCPTAYNRIVGYARQAHPKRGAAPDIRTVRGNNPGKCKPIQ